MSLTILLLVLFIVLLLIYGWRNTYYLLFAALVAAMTVSMFTLTMEVSRASNYLVPANYVIRPLETKLYGLIQSMVHISQSSLILIRNGGMVAYFGVLALFVSSFSDGVRLDAEGAGSQRRLLRFIPLIGFPLLFFLFYHPQTAYRIFLAYHTAADPGRQRAVASMLRTADLAFSGLAILCLSWPVQFLWVNYLKGRMTFLAGYLLRLAVSLLILNVSFYVLFFTGTFRFSTADVLNYGFWRFNLPSRIPVFYTGVLPVVTFAVLVAVFLTLMQLHAGYILTAFKSRGIRKNLDALYANVRNVMHSEKNLLFTIRILAQDALDAQDAGERDRKVRRILDLCSSNMDDLARTLNDAHDMNISTIQNDFIQAVEDALSNQHFPEGTRILRFFPQRHPVLPFDMYHMTHAVANILSNSAEALAASGREDPEIRLTVYTSRAWLYFSVRDNGCGIPAHILHKVEQPYVSTKNKKNSWGIGLSYVFGVVRAHYGQMHIGSRQNEYTQVEILLPRYHKRRLSRDPNPAGRR